MQEIALTASNTFGRNMICARCSKSLERAPAINVREMTFCYKCAKVAAAFFNASSMDSVLSKYGAEKALFDAEKRRFSVSYAAYTKSQTDHQTGRWGCFGVLVVGSFILAAPFLFGPSSNTVWPVWFLVAVAVAVGWWLFIGGKKNELAVNAPIPPVPPRKDSAPEVEISVVKGRTDNEEIPFPDYRMRAILRDNYECQVCGAKKAAQNLEVHHVIPQAKGGNDFLSNLITLCKNCHEKEEWFGHYHKQRSR